MAWQCENRKCCVIAGWRGRRGEGAGARPATACVAVSQPRALRCSPPPATLTRGLRPTNRSAAPPRLGPPAAAPAGFRLRAAEAVERTHLAARAAGGEQPVQRKRVPGAASAAATARRPGAAPPARHHKTAELRGLRACSPGAAGQAGGSHPRAGWSTAPTARRARRRRPGHHISAEPGRSGVPAARRAGRARPPRRGGAPAARAVLGLRASDLPPGGRPVAAGAPARAARHRAQGADTFVAQGRRHAGTDGRTHYK